MQRKSLYFNCCIVFLFYAASAAIAQFPTAPPVAEPTPKVEQPRGPDGRFIAKETASGSAPVQQTQPEFKMNKYDPYLDNHLEAPAQGEIIGLFGMPIKDVEAVLRQYGAKNYSYAFGKYSRMALSAYVITMYFDREKRLGGVAVEPKAPYNAIAPGARKFFKDLFLKGGDISRFRTIIAGNRLEMRYYP